MLEPKRANMWCCFSSYCKTVNCLSFSSAFLGMMEHVGIPSQAQNVIVNIYFHLVFSCVLSMLVEVYIPLCVDPQCFIKYTNTKVQQPTPMLNVCLELRLIVKSHNWCLLPIFSSMQTTMYMFQSKISNDTTIHHIVVTWSLLVVVALELFVSKYDSNILRRFICQWKDNVRQYGL